MSKFTIALTHGMSATIDGQKFYHYHWYTHKRDAEHEAEEARESGFLARVQKKSGGWNLVVRRRKP